MADTASSLKKIDPRKIIILGDANNTTVVQEDPDFPIPDQLNSRLVCTNGHYLFKKTQKKNGNIYYQSFECNTHITDKEFNAIQTFDILGNKMVGCKRKKY